MGNRSRCIKIILISLLLPQLALAQPANGMRGTWYFAFAGIPFAKLWMAVEAKGDQQHVVTDFKSSGIVRMFKAMKTYSEAEVDADGQIRRYETTNKAENKHTLLRFDSSGTLTERVVEPEDEPSHRPPVDAAKVKGADTPISALFALPDRLQQLQEGESDALLMYDGQRLARIHFQHLGAGMMTINDHQVPVTRLALTRELVDGFTEKEKKRYAEGDPLLTVYVRSQDGFPIAAELPMALGTLTARWEAE
tara:strand:+ start:209 stop:961 length:753 start_codon:yes stop_codon:yes gene_type:complete